MAPAARLHSAPARQPSPPRGDPRSIASPPRTPAPGLELSEESFTSTGSFLLLPAATLEPSRAGARGPPKEQEGAAFVY